MLPRISMEKGGAPGPAGLLRSRPTRRRRSRDFSKRCGSESVAELGELCRQLAEGTRGQKRRAWRALVRDGELWRGCARAVGRPDGLEELAASYRRLQGDWARNAILEPSTADPAILGAQIDVVCRLVAAAAVASVAIGHGDQELLPARCLRSAD